MLDSYEDDSNFMATVQETVEEKHTGYWTRIIAREDRNDLPHAIFKIGEELQVDLAIREA